MPWWAVEEAEAARCRMTPPEFVAWRYWGEGAYLLPRFRIKWSVDALAEEAAYDQARQASSTPSRRHALDDGQGGWRTELGGAVAYERGTDGVFRRAG